MHVFLTETRHCRACKIETMQLLERDEESVVRWRCTICGTLEAAGSCDGLARHVLIPKLKKELFCCDECERIWPKLDDLLSPSYSPNIFLDDFLAANGLGAADV